MQLQTALCCGYSMIFIIFKMKQIIYSSTVRPPTPALTSRKEKFCVLTCRKPTSPGSAMFPPGTLDLLPQTLQNLPTVRLTNRLPRGTISWVKKLRHSQIQSATECYPSLNRDSHSKVCVLPMPISTKAVLFVSAAVFPSLKQNLMQMRCSYKSVIPYSRVKEKVNSCSQVTQTVTAAKLTSRARN
jgi:hypothetical protein